MLIHLMYIITRYESNDVRLLSNVLRPGETVIKQRFGIADRQAGRIGISKYVGRIL